MIVIDNDRVVVFNSLELKNVLEEDNSYSYIYFGDDITLESAIYLNKENVIICGTYNGIRYTFTGMNSDAIYDTINANVSNKEITIKNINIVYTNTYGVVNVPADSSYSHVVITYDDVVFNGTELSFNPFGTTRIIDCNITIEDTNNILSQEVCESNRVIIGGNTTIASSSVNNSLFNFRNDIIGPSLVFLCNSNVKISSDTKDFMSGTIKLNFTILHDTTVYLVTGNGFASNTIYGANNVLIDERATFTFIENSHKRIPMWTIYGSLIMKEGSNLEVINSYDNTPTDNYNIHFKGSSCKIDLDNPNSLVIYTKNANILYTKEPLNFAIKCSRINMWSNSSVLSLAGGIDNLPDYFWYKEDGFLEISGVFTSTSTTISSHNLTSEELNVLSSLDDFSFQSRKQFSLGNIFMNVHSISSNSLSISGHTDSVGDVLIEYDGNSFLTSTDSDGLFRYDLSSSLVDGEEISITYNIPGSFLYGTRRVTVPYDGELSLLKATSVFSFLLTPISYNPVILPKDRNLVTKVVDSRVSSSNWKLYAFLKGEMTSLNGYVLDGALIFKKFNDEIVVLNENPVLVYTGTANGGDALVSEVTWSYEKGPLLSLSSNYLEANEEYFACVVFDLKE